jgi:hypothetical protein
MKESSIFATYITVIVVMILHLTKAVILSYTNLYHLLVIVTLIWGSSFVFAMKK